jgi:flagellar hook-associated protein FlgK
MSDLLSIGSSGVYSYQRALSTVANNIANVGTDGYNRQDVAITSSQPRDIGKGFIGTGSRFEGVKRQYDAFLESNLRNSTSDLMGQGPLVQFANRIVDVLANQNIGLTSSLNAFFASARDLSTSPASVVVRGNFLREAEAVTNSFAQLGQQMVDMDQEVLAAINVSTDKINALGEQIALVNKQLFRKSTVATQPPELLDQRDRLLRDLSQIVRINTSFTSNGQVTVSINDSLDPKNAAIIVENDQSHRVLTQYDANTGRVEINIPFAPNDRPKIVTGIRGGELGGYMTIRGQLIEPTLGKLNELATTLMREVNTLHRDGVDARGNVGQDLFGMETTTPHAAINLKALIDDPQAVAAAAPLRVLSGELNVGNARAAWSYQDDAVSNPPTLQSLFPARIGMPGTDMPVVVGSLTAVSTLAAGTQNAVISLDSKEAWPQLITRDGRHLLGKALTPAQQSLLSELPGMQPGATYDTTYLNTRDPKNAYLKADYFIGARASSIMAPAYSLMSDSKGRLATEAVTASNTPALSLAAGDIYINNYKMPALTKPAGSLDAIRNWFNGETTQTGIAAAIETGTDGKQQLVLTASGGQNFKVVGGLDTLRALGMTMPDDLVAPNDQKPVAAYLQSDFVNASGPFSPFALGSNQLLLNGVDLATGLSSASPAISTYPESLASWINSKTAQTGVTASVAYQTFDVNGSPVPRKSLVLSAKDTVSEVKLSFGENAPNPTVLGQLGFRTSLYFDGTAPEDLLVVANLARSNPAVTDPLTLNVSASYSQHSFNRLEALRANPVNIRFGADNTYTIVDQNTGTELAKREFDPHQGFINYQGVQIRFAGLPVAGDTFKVDGNTTGIGDNTAIKAIAELEFKVMGDGYTITDAYIAHTSRMGNMARQAKIGQEALVVVNQQAIETRESAVGVNLDEEAANLIRFQQAYQANAKVMQTSTVLFDALINLR